MGNVAAGGGGSRLLGAGDRDGAAVRGRSGG